LQWRVWREQSPLLLPALALVALLRRRVAPSNSDGSGWRMRFTAVWGVIFAAVLHGTGAIWLFLLLALNFFVAAALRRSPDAALQRRLTTIWSWLFALSILTFAKTRNDDAWRSALEQRAGLGWLVEPPSFAAVPPRPAPPRTARRRDARAGTRGYRLIRTAHSGASTDTARPRARLRRQVFGQRAAELDAAYQASAPAAPRPAAGRRRGE